MDANVWTYVGIAIGCLAVLFGWWHCRRGQDFSLLAGAGSAIVGLSTLSRPTGWLPLIFFFTAVIAIDTTQTRRRQEESRKLKS